MLNVVILAAGQGQRMQSKTPKVLHPIAGQAMVLHVVSTALALKPQSLSIVVGHGAEQVKQTVQSAHSGSDRAIADKFNLHFPVQNPPKGTGHAVLQAIEHLNHTLPTLILYGDVPLVQTQTLQRLIRIAQDGSLALLTQVMDNPTGYGRIVRDHGGNIQCIVEQKDASAEQQKINEINTGLLCAPAGALEQWLPLLTNQNAQNEYYLTDCIALAVQHGVPIKSVQPTFAWETQGVNSQNQRVMLERSWQRHCAEQLLAQGVRLADSERIDIRGKLDVGQDVSIDINCIFEGHVILGDDVSIGPHCVLKDVQIAAGTRVEAFCHLNDTTIGQSVRLGPYARIRPGTQLADDVHIGNFVEIKNSTLNRGSKASHLAYVGDSQVGERVNISAGVITANYDGVNKFTTIIEDDAFIGSDSTLIAPIKIARGTYVAAGSTISKNTTEDKLVISRAKQITIESWKRPTKK